MAKTTQLHKGLSCPHCAEAIDAATSTSGDDQPQPGNISVCFSCGCFLQFVGEPDSLSYIILPKEVLAEIKRDHPDVYQKLIFIRTQVYTRKQKGKNIRFN